MATISQSFFFILPFLLYSRLDIASSAPGCGPLVADDVDRIQFALNLEFLEAEFFLHGALGEGLDQVAPQLARGGPPPIGARKANLDDFERRIIEEFGYQEVGHLRLVVIYIYIYTCILRFESFQYGFFRAITSAVEGLPRPQLDLSPQNFQKILHQAIGLDLKPPMDPYSNTVNYLLASYVIPYVGLVGYVGTIPSLTNSSSLSVRITDNCF